MCLKYRDDIGIDHIMWECDYPHTDVAGQSQSTTQEVFKAAGVSDEEADAHHPRQRRAGLQLEDRLGRSADQFHTGVTTHRLDRRAVAKCTSLLRDEAAVAQLVGAEAVPPPRRGLVDC